jgi:hypothetical protein
MAALAYAFTLVFIELEVFIINAGLKKRKLFFPSL